MAAKVLQVIGTVLIIISTIILIALLPLLARFLKKLHRSLKANRGKVGERIGGSLSGIDAARKELDGVAAVTASVRSGLSAAVRTADRAVGFMESNAFQLGVPLLIWFLLLAVALPRGLLRLRKKRKVKPIPPPSWEKGEEGPKGA